MHQRLMFANNGRNRYNLSDYYQKSHYNLPIRVSGLHVCFPGSFTLSNKKALFIELCKPLIMVIVGKQTRAYLRIHTGTNMECNYSLQSFGIPVGDIPRTGTGTPKLKNHVRFFKCRQAVENNLQDHAVRALATSSSTAFLLQVSPEQLRMNASMASITSSGSTPTNMFMNMNMDASASSVLSLPPQFETRNKKKSSTSSNKKPALSNKELKEVKKKRIEGYRLLYQVSSPLELPSQLKSQSMATTTTTLQPPPYIECPDFNCVLFRKNGLSYQHPGNVKFRDVLHRLYFLTPPLPLSLKSINSSISDGSDPSETVDETLNDDVSDSAAVTEEVSTLQKKTKKKRKHRQPPQLQPSNSYTVDTVLHHSFGIGLQFLLFDEQQHWYVEMTDAQELRKAISRAMNYTKRRIIVQLTAPSSSTPSSVSSSTEKDTPTTTETNRNKKKRPRNHPSPDNINFNTTGMLNPTFGQQQQQLSRQASLQHQNFGGCFLNLCGISTNHNTNNNNNNNSTNNFLNSSTYTNDTAHLLPQEQQQQQQHPQRNSQHPYWQQEPDDFAAAEDDYEPIQIQSLIPSPALPPQNPPQPQASTVPTMDDEMFDLDTTFIHTVE